MSRTRNVVKGVSFSKDLGQIMNMARSLNELSEMLVRGVFYFMPF